MLMKKVNRIRWKGQKLCMNPTADTGNLRNLPIWLEWKISLTIQAQNF
jgi:hypothetical protein